MKYTLSLLLFISLFLVGCSDKEDEPINSVFAFSSSESNISITNNGTNCVVNATAQYQTIKINLLGTFINTDIESPSKWIKASISDKVLTLTLDENFSEDNRSANIAIKANDMSEIVIANLVVNQSTPTDEDKDAWQLEDIQYVIDLDGGAETLPSNGQLEKNVWYSVNNDKTLYFRLVNREENSQLIEVGNVVYPNYAVCSISDMLYEPADWWYYAFYTNKDDNQPLTVAKTYSAADKAKWSTGILDLLNLAPLRYGDDVDILMTSYLGFPEYMQYHMAYVYVVQFYETANNKSSSVIAKSTRKNSNRKL